MAAPIRSCDVVQPGFETLRTRAASTAPAGIAAYNVRRRPRRTPCRRLARSCRSGCPRRRLRTCSRGTCTHSYIVRGWSNPESFHSCNRHDARHHARRVHPWGAGALRPLLAASRWTRRDGPLRRAGGVPAYRTRAHRAAQPLRLHPRGAIAGPEGPGDSPGRRRCRDRTRRRGGRQAGPQSDWYLHRFVGDDPFRRRAIDIKTLAMVAMGAGYRATTKSSLPEHWRPPVKHTHVAVEDAIEQGELFMNIVRELNAQRGAIVPPASRKTARRRRHDQRR